MTQPETPLERTTRVLADLTTQADALGDELRRDRDELTAVAKVIERSNRLIRRRNIFLLVTICSVVLDIVITTVLFITTVRENALQRELAASQASAQAANYANCKAGLVRTGALYDLNTTLLRSETKSYDLLLKSARNQPAQSAAQQRQAQRFYKLFFVGPIDAYRAYLHQVPKLNPHACDRYAPQPGASPSPRHSP